MLTFPNGDCRYRVVGIDPGTDTMGGAVIDVDLSSGAISLDEALTFNGSQMAKRFATVATIHGDRIARLMAHEENLTQFFKHTGPHSIACESPYLGRFPQAFAALTECVTAIRRAVHRYDAYLPLLLVDPPTAKKAVGAYGRSSDKDDIKRAILGLDNFHNPKNIDIEKLDEHSIDAIAVAYYRAKYFVANN